MDMLSKIVFLYTFWSTHNAMNDYSFLFTPLVNWEQYTIGSGQIYTIRLL